MRLSLLRVLIIFATIFICRAAEISQYNENNEKDRVVYLIDTLNGKKSATDQNGKTHEASYTLVDPIPESLAGDGVYFRPSDGRPVEKVEVITFSLIQCPV